MPENELLRRRPSTQDAREEVDRIQGRPSRRKSPSAPYWMHKPESSARCLHRCPGAEIAVCKGIQMGSFPEAPAPGQIRQKCSNAFAPFGLAAMTPASDSATPASPSTKQHQGIGFSQVS